MTDLEIQRQNVLLSVASERQFSQQSFWAEHSLSTILSGSGKVFNNDETQYYRPGAIGFLKRNQIARSEKIPGDNGEPFKSIGLLLDQQTLRAYAIEHDQLITTAYQGRGILQLQSDAFLSGFFASLLPYFEDPKKLTPALVKLKTTEAIELLLAHDPQFANILFDFHEPFKIDLEQFMTAHFSYNLSITQFARLTGRSLSTFRRDFKHIFADTPERWLKQMRLEKAHFLITEKNQRPSDVYLNLGFTNLSHFSASFRRHFGYNASEATRYR